MSDKTSSTYRLLLLHSTSSILLAVTAVFLLVQFYRFNTISINHYESTAIDRYRSEHIADLILQYETNHQTKITTVTPAFDGDVTYVYPGVFHAGDINISSYVTSWSDVTSLSYWGQNHLTRQEPTAEWADYCQSHNWNTFSPDQIKFYSSTLQICIY